MRKYLELLPILGSRRRWSYVLFFFLSVFLLKSGQVFVFAEVCRFLLVTDVQPPLCWRPRKFWTTALLASRDWYKVFTVKSGVFFKPAFTRNKTSSCEWGPCCRLKLSKTKSLGLASPRSAMVLEATWQKNGFSKCNDEVKPQFYFIYFACFSFATNRKCLNIFSVGCSLGRSWRGLSVSSQ